MIRCKPQNAQGRASGKGKEQMETVAQLLRVPQVAARLNLSRSKTYELVGVELRPIRIGRAIRIPASEVEAFIARRLADNP